MGYRYLFQSARSGSSSRSFVRLFGNRAHANVSFIEINRIRTKRCWAISMDTVRNSHAFSCSGQFARALPSQGARATSSRRPCQVHRRNKTLYRVQESWHTISNTPQAHRNATRQKTLKSRDLGGQATSFRCTNLVRWSLFRPVYSAIYGSHHTLMRVGRNTYCNVLSYQHQ